MLHRLQEAARRYLSCYHVYDIWSKKHVRRYASEFVFRFNEGKIRNHTVVRLNHIICIAIGKRLTYEDLTG